MSEQMFYNSQLAILADGVLIPIHSFDRTIETPEERIHHIHRANNGSFSKPTEIGITFKLYEIGKGKEAYKMLLFQLNRTTFSVVMAEHNGHDWTFNSIGFEKCKITKTETNYKSDGPPEITITAICLEFSVDNAFSFGSA